MATVEQWDEFARELAEQQEIQRQNLNNILNDPGASQATKDKAVNDFIQQEYYNNWIQEQNDQIQITGIIPVSLTIPSKTIQGALWIDVADGNKIKSGTVESFTNGQIISSDRVHVADLDGTSIDLWVENTSTNPQTRIQSVRWSSGTGYYEGYFICYDANNDGNIKWHFGSSNSHYDSPSYYSGSRNGYACWWHTGASSPPTHNGFANMARWSATTSSNYGEYLVSRTQDYVFNGGQVDPDAPWDFYNDEVLPNVDPSNAFFPDGYRPTEPDDPPDEPTDIPHDDGEPPEHQRDRAVGLPSQFITQYLLSYSQLQTFGLNLWQSWLTPNTDVWKNFFLPYASDFGTLNIGACLDFIISLRVYPVDFADYLDLIGSSAGLYMGTGHTDFLGTSCAITRKLFHAFDCGTCEVKPEKPYNDFRDMYNTSVSVVLPYCGTVELTPAEVMYRNLRAYYYVDFQSGACTAVVEVEGDSGWYMVASKTGQMGFLLPITATNAGQLSAQFGKDATETFGTLAGWFFDTAKTIGNGLFGMAGSYLDKKSSEEEKLMGVGKSGFDMLVNHGQTNVSTGIELVNQSLDRLSRSGIDMPMLSGGGGTEALMFPDTPYVQIRRGKYAKPDNYPHSQGFLNGSSNTIEYYKGAFQGSPTIDPSYQGRGLCKFTGVDSTGLTCNNDERVEIVNLLESGIYI